MNELVPKFKESLFQKIEEFSQDYMEIGIDSIMQDGIVKEVPIMKSVFSASKIFMTIRERLYSLGLIGIMFKSLNDEKLKNESMNYIRTLSALGIRFCRNIFDMSKR